jgi:Arm DNA-binding domain
MPRRKKDGTLAAPPRKRKLTALDVIRLGSAARAYLVWDTNGLALRVQPSGARAWKCIYSHHGRPRWLHLGKADAIGLSDARRLAAEAMLQVAKGHDPAAEKRAERTKGTWAELGTAYVERRVSFGWLRTCHRVRSVPLWARERTRYRGRARRGCWLCAVEALTMLIEQR